MTDKGHLELLEAVKITGEGKGRLTLGQNQYVFGVDSVLKDQDWILAVSIPLHGEEVMILKDLKEKSTSDLESESFEKRIQWEFRRRNLNRQLTGEKFLAELRTMVRFILSRDLELKRQCNAHKDEYHCILDGETFVVRANEKKLQVLKEIGKEQWLELVAQNLTDSFFSRNDFFLYTKEADFKKNRPAFSLELFW